MMNTNASVKNIVRARKIIVGILAHVFVRIASSIENSDTSAIIDTSVSVCDETVNATENAWTNVNIPTK